MVDHGTLARGYAAAGFLLYPTSYPETGCVTLMKAQAMGAIPVTSRYARSTLPELTGAFDLGPPRALRATEGSFSAARGGDGEWVAGWIDAVVDAAARNARGELHEHRAAMKRDARERFLWDGVAGLWDGHFRGPAAAT
jgi:glycosyltransferase involved in cell wall biosynthesis